MLQSVDVGERPIQDYRHVVPSRQLEALTSLAGQLRGLRVLHVSATPYGGGVSELLRSAVPLLADLGLVVDWQVISGGDGFFDVTKRIHNALQGAPVNLSEEERELFRRTSEGNAGQLQGDYDVIVVHDPQPVALRSLGALGARADTKWVWRCHIDTSQPDPATWRFLRGYLEGYDAAVFTMDQFVPPDMPVDKIAIIPPAIDPLSPKNLPLAASTARQVLQWIGIRLDAPLVTQVSRFDPWKDPLGVIEAYRMVRERIPDLQLALVGSMALDDPEGWRVYETIRKASIEDPLIHVFTNLTGVGNIEVNALQRVSDVVIQKSIREGFGLVVSEALWKRTPVVAGNAGGIPLQMADGCGGWLVDSTEQCADAVLRLLEDPAAAEALAERGHRRVRDHFLMPRLLQNELGLLSELVAGATPVSQAWATSRDPVCGLAVGDVPQERIASVGTRTYMFCSATCKQRFVEDPDRWISQHRDPSSTSARASPP